MPIGNFDAPPPAEVPAASPARRFRLPSDYYSAPLSEVRPVFPRWVPMGCGIAAALFVLILFGSAAVMTGPRLAVGVDFIIGMSLGDLRGMAAGVPPEKMARFEREVTAMRKGLTSNQIAVADVQPFLQSMQKAITDKKVTADEIDELATAANRISTKRGTPPKR